MGHSPGDRLRPFDAFSGGLKQQKSQSGVSPPVTLIVVRNPLDFYNFSHPYEENQQFLFTSSRTCNRTFPRTSARNFSHVCVTFCAIRNRIEIRGMTKFVVTENPILVGGGLLWKRFTPI